MLRDGIEQDRTFRNAVLRLQSKPIAMDDIRAAIASLRELEPDDTGARFYFEIPRELSRPEASILLTTLRKAYPSAQMSYLDHGATSIALPKDDTPRSGIEIPVQQLFIELKKMEQQLLGAQVTSSDGKLSVTYPDPQFHIYSTESVNADDKLFNSRSEAQKLAQAISVFQESRSRAAD